MSIRQLLSQIGRRLVPDALRQLFKFKLRNPLVYHADNLMLKLNSRGRTTSPIRLLLVSDGWWYTSEQQLVPFHTYRKCLRDTRGLVSYHVLLKEALKWSEDEFRQFDWIALKTCWQTPKEDLHVLIEHFSRVKGKAKLSYFDGDDDLCILNPQILNSLDLYVKKHGFSDSSLYCQSYTGKSNLTDYVHQTYGISFKGDCIPYSNPVLASNVDKVFIGWNIALDDKIRKLLRKEGKRLILHKPIDLLLRAPAFDNWIGPLRRVPQERLMLFKNKYHVQASNHRVSQSVYNCELRDSKICICPFGAGEICWRDFEAVIFRSLLIKPDMSHLQTTPNIFVPFKTYVPVRWDYEDLEEKCDYYLAHPEERKKITEEAFRTLADFYASRGFIDQVDQLIARLGIAQN